MSDKNSQSRVLDYKHKELLYNLFYELTSEIKGCKIEIDEEEYEENIRTINYKQLLTYVRDSIKILLCRRNDEIKELKDKLNSKNYFKPTKSELIQYENLIKKYENNERKYISRQFQDKLQREAFEVKIGEYSQMEEEFEEMKIKLKYENGKFLNNERKENEIIILRGENTNLKSEISELEKNFSESNKKNQLLLNDIQNFKSEIEKLKSQLEEKEKELNLFSNININISNLGMDNTSNNNTTTNNNNISHMNNVNNVNIHQNSNNNSKSKGKNGHRIISYDGCCPYCKSNLNFISPRSTNVTSLANFNNLTNSIKHEKKNSNVNNLNTNLNANAYSSNNYNNTNMNNLNCLSNSNNINTSECNNSNNQSQLKIFHYQKVIPSFSKPKKNNYVSHNNSLLSNTLLKNDYQEKNKNDFMYMYFNNKTNKNKTSLNNTMKVTKLSIGHLSNRNSDIRGYCSNSNIYKGNIPLVSNLHPQGNNISGISSYKQLLYQNSSGIKGYTNRSNSNSMNSSKVSISNTKRMSNHEWKTNRGKNGEDK